MPSFDRFLCVFVMAMSLTLYLKYSMFAVVGAVALALAIVHVVGTRAIKR
jgi:hypothetical protein